MFGCTVPFHEFVLVLELPRIVNFGPGQNYCPQVYLSASHILSRPTRPAVRKSQRVPPAATTPEKPQKAEITKHEVRGMQSRVPKAVQAKARQRTRAVRQATPHPIHKPKKAQMEYHLRKVLSILNQAK